MKKKVTLLAFLMFSVISVFGQNADSLLMEKINAVERQNYTLSQRYDAMQANIAKLEQTIIGLSAGLEATDSSIANVDERYGLHLEQTDSTVQINESKRQKAVMWGIVIAALLAVASAIVYLLLRIRIAKKGNDIELLRARADDLNRQIVERMDKELDELLKIVSQTPTTTNTANVEPDHTLVKALADRITFMEMTLYRMDPSVKGHKHLTKSIKQMKDNLLANGYEIVEMLGKDYVEGLKASPSFNDDDTLERGKRIITGITKPQINYKGQMIQAAQITVSQNI